MTLRNCLKDPLKINKHIYFYFYCMVVMNIFFIYYPKNLFYMTSYFLPKFEIVLAMEYRHS